MSQVTVHYKIYLIKGHHRQPRNANAELEPNPPSQGDNITTPYYLPQLPYPDGMAQLLFWSVTDGSSGQTYPAGPLTLPVSPNPLTVTAWYFPIGGGPGPTFIIDDAFSALKGDFIDDTFVTVTSDPSLTNQANVVGIVPTATAETLKSSASVASTPEPFSKWLSFGAGTSIGDTLSVPADATGIAIAIYEQSLIVTPIWKDNGEAISGTVIGGVSVDGGGAIIIGGVPHPVDPWGPLVVQLVNASLVVAGSRSMDRRIFEQVRQLAAQSVVQEIKQAMPKIEEEASGKG